jgi:hypothetical protein
VRQAFDAYYRGKQRRRPGGGGRGEEEAAPLDAVSRVVSLRDYMVRLVDVVDGLVRTPADLDALIASINSRPDNNISIATVVLRTPGAARSAAVHLLHLAPDTTAAPTQVSRPPPEAVRHRAALA